MDAVRLGDTGTPDACLNVCKQQGQVAGCWWLDGKGGFGRECRVCKTLTPVKANWPNDWAMPISASPGASAAPAAAVASPAALGFAQYYKCPSDADAIRLGDTVTPDACLNACNQQGQAAGCWWLDGTGGFGRECRVCKTLTPAKGHWANDWAMPISK
jgi:hypothetical protein